MEINGKKVLTLPNQVLQNQKDIHDIKMSTPYLRHKFNVTLSLSENYQDLITFDIYTTDDLTADDITLDYIKTYLTNKTVACNGLVENISDICLAYKVTYDGSKFIVAGLKLDLTDSFNVNEFFDVASAIKIY